ncbi:RNA polymerase sigma factor sigE, chloroplastic/mitochondrial-like protein [Drosera capensis]
MKRKSFVNQNDYCFNCSHRVPGMGVVTLSSSAARTTSGLDRRLTTFHSPVKRPIVLAFKMTKNKDRPTLVSPHESTPLPIDTTKKRQRRSRSVAKSSKTEVKTAHDVQVPLEQDVGLDYAEAVSKLESMYKLSPSINFPDSDDMDELPRQGHRGRRKNAVIHDDVEKGSVVKVVRNMDKKVKRLNLDKRIQMKKSENGEVISLPKMKGEVKSEDEKIKELVREYSRFTNMGSVNWKTGKMPPTLPSSEQAWLFELMQLLKVLKQAKENLRKELHREPTDYELGKAMKMTVIQLRKQMDIGIAARNKLIKHNPRLISYTMKRYFKEFAKSHYFQDLCQAGVKGLIIAIDRFDPKRNFSLSSYALFSIRHAIARQLTISNFLRIPFGLESVRSEIRKAKRELTNELNRTPTEEEIIKRAKITPERYFQVMSAFSPVRSLNRKSHLITGEELIDGIADDHDGDSDVRKHSALHRLALDDVLDSLIPKESLVIRQRYGLDGGGDRTLGEIASNLNISREMVRKYETKALMKLKHPDRVDYLGRHIFMNQSPSVRGLS